MVSIVKIETALIEAGRRILKAIRFGTKDGKQSFEAMPYGIDSSPIKGMRAIYAPTGTSGKSVIIGYINTDQIAEEGETRIFSSGGEIWLRTNGTCEILGTGNFLVKFNELETAFNQLKTDFNTHTHIDPVSGSLPPPTTPSIANVSEAKAGNIKTGN
jgi:hypothetical protein